MKLEYIKFYEGNNIKRHKSVIKLVIIETSLEAADRISKLYINLNMQLGFEEKLIELKEQDSKVLIWISYTQEVISRFIWMNLIYETLPPEDIAKDIRLLLEKGFIYDLVKKAEECDIPVIKVSMGIYQLGYGKSSLIISSTYQSYEDTCFVKSTLDRCFLFQHLQYNHFATVNGQIIYCKWEVGTYTKSYPVTLCSVNKSLGIKITVEDENSLKSIAKQFLESEGEVFIYSGKENYRIICIEGIVKHIFTLYPLDNNSSKFREDNVFYEDQIKKLAKKIYEITPIQFMYIDLQINDLDELIIVDLGCVFYLLESFLKQENEILQDILLRYLKVKLINSIPIFAITGTNGKTTTARLLYNMLMLLGYNTGLTCTGGILIGDKKIEAGDTTGFLSARKVLQNRNVEAAVFETARGGIIRNGLGFDKISGAIITSLSEDHIGLDSINTLEDLAAVKSLVLEDVQIDGKWVLRAQKEIVNEAKKRFENIKEKGRITSFEEKACLFDIDKNALIQEHLKHMGEAFYVEEQYIMQCIGRKIYKLIPVKEIPFTHCGISEANILNVMATLAILSPLGVKTSKLLELIRTIPSDASLNPGRQNIFTLKDMHIILDYGHNAEAYNQIYSLVKGLGPTHTTSIISAPGDRLDQYIEDLGYLSGKSSDFIILREHKHQRGSVIGRVASLMKKGALSSGLTGKNICFINDAVDALNYAIKMAIKGEVIVLFTEEPELMTEKITAMVSLS